ncbi:MAG TPA: ROK family protein [candidate division Zixibacteria bacterium]|nr:ROK family protein [candidate division Zixibacteria bacterium]
MTNLRAGGFRSEAIGQRSETVRRSNLAVIARQLHLYAPLSRSQLVARTGLTRSAIRGLIGELLANGLVSEERSESLGVPGRPSTLVRPNTLGAVVLALEVSVDSLAAAMVGFGGTVHRSVRVERPRAHLAPDQIVADLVELARPLLRRVRDRQRLIGVGVAMVGIVRQVDGLVRFAPNLGWRDVPLGSMLSAALAVDVPVLVANEADLGVLAEHRRGAARGIRDAVYIAGEVGVGGGILVDGTPLRGADGYAGEIGHLPVNPTGRNCRCGSVGCLETEVGERALLDAAGRPPDGGPDELERLLADAEAGDQRALDALRRVGEWLGVGLAAVVNAFNPRVIVLGGLFDRIHPFIIETVESRLAARALDAPRELVRIVPAALGTEAVLLGAAEHAFEPFLSDPAAWLAPRDGEIRLASA